MSSFIKTTAIIGNLAGPGRQTKVDVRPRKDAPPALASTRPIVGYKRPGGVNMFQKVTFIYYEYTILK